MTHYFKWSICAGLLFWSSHAAAQQPYTIEGEVQHVEDGTIVSLFLMDGNTGSAIAIDTIRHGRFRFAHTPEGDGLQQLNLACARSDKFPKMSLQLWARQGSHLKITGDNTLIATWQVESDVPMQQIHQNYIHQVREQMDDLQRCNIRLSKLLRGPYHTDEEKARAKASIDSLKRCEAPINDEKAKRTIAYMQQQPVEPIWMEHLWKLAMESKYRKGFPYKDEVKALYNRLTETEKQEEKAKEAYVMLYPPQVVEQGETMADATLYDLQGEQHRLTDYLGKYILLDIWSSGCGPCIQSIPEMKEVAGRYRDRLTVIGISIDEKETWRKASERHQPEWPNLNELNGERGLYAKYGVTGIPFYVLISPEGKVVSKWSGYGKGSLLNRLQTLPDKP